MQTGICFHYSMRCTRIHEHQTQSTMTTTTAQETLHFFRHIFSTRLHEHTHARAHVPHVNEPTTHTVCAYCVPTIDTAVKHLYQTSASIHIRTRPLTMYSHDHIMRYDSWLCSLSLYLSLVHMRLYFFRARVFCIFLRF